MEYEQRYQDKNGVEVSIKLKTEHSGDIDLRGTLNFLAKSSHRFYLEAGEKMVQANERVREADKDE